MHVYVHDKTLTYSGKQLSSHWAFKNFGLMGDSIVCFRGPCRVEATEMVDVEDVLSGSKIYGSDMLHFIVEHFGSGLEKGVLMQRILMAIIKDVLGGDASIVRKGNDLYAADGKLSISVTTLSPISVMIHSAINVVSDGTPIKTAGLFDVGFAESEVMDIGRKICALYAEEMLSIRMDCCKVRGVD